MIKPAASLVLLLCLPGWAWGAEKPTFSGQESNPIKALSPAGQAGLLAGKGMGLARAAELNGYPGPAHVLELAGELALTAAQRAESEALYQAMEAHAQAIGAQLVEAERRLDDLFANRQITPESLTDALDRIGSLQAKLRAVHLEAHLDQAALLSVQQIALYNQHRGYTGGGEHGSHHHH